MNITLLSARAMSPAAFSRFRHRRAASIAPVGRFTMLAKSLSASVFIPRDVATLPAFPEAAE